MSTMPPPPTPTLAPTSTPQSINLAELLLRPSQNESNLVASVRSHSNRNSYQNNWNVHNNNKEEGQDVNMSQLNAWRERRLSVPQHHQQQQQQQYVDHNHDMASISTPSVIATAAVHSSYNPNNPNNHSNSSTFQINTPWRSSTGAVSTAASASAIPEHPEEISISIIQPNETPAAPAPAPANNHQFYQRQHNQQQQSSVHQSSSYSRKKHSSETILTPMNRSINNSMDMDISFPNQKHMLGLVETLQNNLADARQFRTMHEGQIRHLNMSITGLRAQIDEMNELHDGTMSQFRGQVDSALGLIHSIIGEAEESVEIKQYDQTSALDDFQTQFLRFNAGVTKLISYASQLESIQIMNDQTVQVDKQKTQAQIILKQVMFEKKQVEDELLTLKSTRQESELKISNAIRDVAQAEEHNAALKKEIATAELRLDSQEQATFKSIEASKQAIEQTKQLKLEAQTLSGQIKKLINEKVAKDNALIQISRELDSAKEDLSRTRESYDAINHQITLDREESQLLLKEAEQLQTKNKQNSEEIEQTLIALDEREKRIKSKESTLERKEKSLTQNQIFLDERAAILEKEEEQLVKLQTQLMEMQTVQMETEQAQNTQISELNSRESASLRKENELSSLQDKIDERLDQLTSHFQKIRQREDLLDSMEVEIHDRAIELKVAEETSKTSDLDLQKRETALAEKAQSLIERENIFKQQRHEFLNFKQKIDSEKDSLKLSSVELERNQLAMEEEQVSMKAAKNSLDNEQKRLFDWAAEISTLDEALQLRLQDVASKNSILSSLESKLLGKAKDLDMREGQITAREEGLKAATHSRSLEEERTQALLSNARRELNNIETKVIDHRRRCSEAEADYKRITADSQTIRSSLKSKLSSAENELTLNRKQQEDCQKELSQIRAEIKGALEEKAKIISDQEKESGKASGYLKTLNDEVNLLRSKIIQENKSYDQLQDNISKRKHDYDLLLGKMKSEKENFKKVMSEEKVKAEADVESAYHEILKEKEIISKTRRGFEKERREVESSRRELMSLSEELEEEKNSIRKEKVTLSKEKKQYLEAKSQLSRAQENIESERMSIIAVERQLRAELDTSNNNCARLDHEVSQLRELNTSLSTKCSVADSSKRDIEQFMKIIEKQATKLEAKEADLEEKHKGIVSTKECLKIQMQELEIASSQQDQRERLLSEKETLLKEGRAEMEENESVLQVRELNLKTCEVELDIRSKKCRQKLMALAIVSTRSKIRSSLLSRTILHWWRITCSERNHQQNLEAEKTLQEKIGALNEKLEHDQKETKRIFISQEASLKAREDKLIQKENTLSKTETDLKINLESLHIAQGEVAAERKRLEDQAKNLEFRKYDANQREKELDELKIEIEREMLHLEEVGIKEDKVDRDRMEIKKKSDCLLVEKQDLERKMKDYDSKLAVVEENAKSLAAAGAKLKVKERELEDSMIQKSGTEESTKVLSRLKACHEYEAKLKSWEKQLDALSKVMKERENDINTRELRVIGRM